MPIEQENEQEEEVKPILLENSSAEKPKKRKNSLTDESSSSSSNCSLSSSSTSTDTDDAVSSSGEKEKGTMTNENAVDDLQLEDPTEEPNGKKVPVRLISRKSPVKVSEESHFVPITIPRDSPPEENKATSSKKKNSRQKTRLLTKKERRVKENAAAGLFTNVGLSVKNREQNTSSANDGVRNGEMLVRPKNEAARRILNNQDEMSVPYYDSTAKSERTLNQSSLMFPRNNNVSTTLTASERAKMSKRIDALNHEHHQKHQKNIFLVPNTTNRISFCDCHETGQNGYWDDVMKTRAYLALSIPDKLKQYMGHGIAASGFHDDAVLMMNTYKMSYTCKETFTQISEQFHENWKVTYAEGMERENTSLVNNKTVAVTKSIVDTMWDVFEREQNPWMKKLLEYVLRGQTIKAWNRIRKLASVLRKKKPYSTMPSVSLYTLIVEKVLTLLSCKKRNINVVMYLASHKINDQRCFRTGHKSCMMLDSLLAAIPEFSRKNHLSAATVADQLTALHLAAMSGYSCQMDILLKYKPNVDVRCHMGRTPLYYASRRSFDLMTRQLLWAGADVGSLTRNSTLESDFYGLDFAKRRVTALEIVFKSWFHTILNGIVDLEAPKRMIISETVTELHTISLDPNVEDGTVNDTTKLLQRSLRIKMRREVMKTIYKFKSADTAVSPKNDLRLVIALLPVMYTKRDVIMPAELPHIVRVPLIEEPSHVVHMMARKMEYIKMLKDQKEEQSVEIGKNCEHIQPFGLIRKVFLLIDGVKHPLDSAVKLEHNGTLYLYSFPDDLAELTKVNTVELQFEEVYNRHMAELQGTMFMAQGFLLQNAELPNVLKHCQSSKEKHD